MHSRTITLTDEEYTLIGVALASHANAFRERVEKFPYPGSERNAEEIEALRDRFIESDEFEYHSGAGRGDREDFHSDG
jgi:hypothetical protein